MRSLYLTGFMGAGKTCVGEILAGRLNFAFIDTDDLVVAKAGMAIPQIFATKGEAAFRDLERQICLSMPEGAVVALGGGAFMDPAIRRDIGRRGISVFLDWPFEVLLARIGNDPERPLSAAGPALKERFQARYPIYCKADVVWRSQSPHAETAAEVAEAVLGALPGQALG